MGECIISRGASGASGGSSSNQLVTELIIQDTIWVVPNSIKNNQVTVRIFGAGANGSGSCGGGGGYMNNGVVNVASGELIHIQIGNSGGGTTSFGTYLSALGATGRNGGSGGGSYNTGIGGTGFQFGGGGGCNNSGGYGGYWGGGGGGCTKADYSNTYGGCIFDDLNNVNSLNGFSKLGGQGGQYPKHSGQNNSVFPDNGVNTIGKGLEFEGAGKSGHSSISSGTVFSGGGGYGGNGGGGFSGSYSNANWRCGAGGGGGGYGGNGGTTSVNYACGGGGGYGGDGGNGFNATAGGGGGYGKIGHGGEYNNSSKTGIVPGFAAGGCSTGIAPADYTKGGQGICIIQYYLD